CHAVGARAGSEHDVRRGHRHHGCRGDGRVSGRREHADTGRQGPGGNRQRCLRDRQGARRRRLGPSAGRRELAPATRPGDAGEVTAYRTTEAAPATVFRVMRSLPRRVMARASLVATTALVASVTGLAAQGTSDAAGVVGGGLLAARGTVIN